MEYTSLPLSSLNSYSNPRTVGCSNLDICVYRAVSRPALLFLHLIGSQGGLQAPNFPYVLELEALHSRVVPAVCLVRLPHPIKRRAAGGDELRYLGPSSHRATQNSRINSHTFFICYNKILSLSIIASGHHSLQRPTA